MNQQQQMPPPQTQPQNPKKSSFQITSVTIDSSVSNDGGDDSADELDSHTEDSSDFGTGMNEKLQLVLKCKPSRCAIPWYMLFLTQEF
jgi:hypothetical protein